MKISYFYLVGMLCHSLFYMWCGVQLYNGEEWEPLGYIALGMLGTFVIFAYYLIVAVVHLILCIHRQKRMIATIKENETVV